MNADRDPDVVFRSTLYLMDIERVRFSLSRYLRTRVKKIEDQIHFLVTNADALARLSPQEKLFALKLNELNESFLDSTIYSRLKEEQRQAASSGDELLKHSQPELQVIISFSF
jgi:hypothetical protein